MSTEDLNITKLSPISKLRKLQSDWLIKVKVLRRGTIHPYTNKKGSGEMWKLILIDDEICTEFMMGFCETRRGTYIKNVVYKEVLRPNRKEHERENVDRRPVFYFVEAEIDPASKPLDLVLNGGVATWHLHFKFPQYKNRDLYVIGESYAGNLSRQVCFLKSCFLMGSNLLLMFTQHFTVTYNTVDDGYNKAKMFELRENSLTDMIDSGSCLPDVFTMNFFIGACGNSGQIEKMEKWYDEFQFRGIKPDMKTFNILIRSYGKASMYEKMNFVLSLSRKSSSPQQSLLSI